MPPFLLHVVLLLFSLPIPHNTLRSYDPCAGYGYLFYNLSETSGPCTLTVEEVGGTHLVLFRVVYTSWSIILLVLIITRPVPNASKPTEKQGNKKQNETKKSTSFSKLTDAVASFKTMDVIRKVHILFGTPMAIAAIFWSLFPIQLLQSKLLTRIWLVCAAVVDVAPVSVFMWIATAVRVSTYFVHESMRTAWRRTHVMLGAVWVLECTLHQLRFQGDDYTLYNGTYTSLAVGIFDLSLLVTLTLNWIQVQELRRWVVWSLRQMHSGVYTYTSDTVFFCSDKGLTRILLLFMVLRTPYSVVSLVSPVNSINLFCAN